jgi:hypothetical protein
MLVLLSVGEVASLRLKSPLGLWAKTPDVRAGDSVREPLAGTAGGDLMPSSSEAGFERDPGFSLESAFLSDMMVVVVVRDAGRRFDYRRRAGHARSKKRD